MNRISCGWRPVYSQCAPSRKTRRGSAPKNNQRPDLRRPSDEGQTLVLSDKRTRALSDKRTRDSCLQALQNRNKEVADNRHAAPNTHTQHRKTTRHMTARLKKKDHTKCAESPKRSLNGHEPSQVHPPPNTCSQRQTTAASKLHTPVKSPPTTATGAKHTCPAVQMDPTHDRKKNDSSRGPEKTTGSMTLHKSAILPGKSGPRGRA